MQYDPRKTALFHPEAQPPLTMDAGWPVEAICAEFSRLAYFPGEQAGSASTPVTDAVAQIGFADAAFFDSDGTGRWRADAQGFAAIDGTGHAIVAFRGTQIGSLWDLLTDLSFWPTRWHGTGRVHCGFWTALSAILPQVEAWLGRHNVRRLTVTGHSLGAAMATLLAGLKPDADLVTFGSPRVGNRAFVDSFGQRKIRRYVDTTDFVPGLPPPIYYRHLDGLHYIDSTGRVQFPGTGPTKEDTAKAAADYAPCRLNRENAPLRRLADHAPINYIGAVMGGRTGPVC